MLRAMFVDAMYNKQQKLVNFESVEYLKKWWRMRELARSESVGRLLHESIE
jgi:hypothetical protein